MTLQKTNQTISNAENSMCKEMYRPMHGTLMPMTKHILAFALQKHKSAFLLPKRKKE